MQRKLWLGFLLSIVIAGLGIAPVGAREVLLTTEAMRVENVDGDPVIHFSSFRAESDEYVLTGASGRFVQKSNEMLSLGDDAQPATLAKHPFDEETDTPSLEDEPELYISASRSIWVHFDDERLQAHGDVTYRTEDTMAWSDLLIVDVKEAIWDHLAATIEAMPRGEPRTLVMQFFDALSPDARLVLLQGNVRVEREDAEIEGAWMLFDEEDGDNFISVADVSQPLRLRMTLSEDEDDPGDGDAVEASADAIEPAASNENVSD